MLIVFEVIEGPHKGKRFEYSEHNVMIVGRSNKAHFQLSGDDVYFSRVHFMVEVNPPHCRLIDMGSRNGTVVNGKKVVSGIDLQSGDLIKGGKTVIQVILCDDDREPLTRDLLSEDIPNRTEAATGSGPSTLPLLTLPDSIRPESESVSKIPRDKPVKKKSKPPSPPSPLVIKSIFSEVNSSLPTPIQSPNETPIPTTGLSIDSLSDRSTPYYPPNMPNMPNSANSPPESPPARSPKTAPGMPVIERNPQSVNRPLPAPLPPPQVMVTRECMVCGVPCNNFDRTGVTLRALCAKCAGTMEDMPQNIRGYRILRELGRGGMGIVYLAMRESDADLIALKTIMPAVACHPRETERFLREATILNQLRHRYIVTFRENGDFDGMLFFAMDFVRGTDAQTILKREGPFEIARAVRLVCQMLEALEFAHGRSFVHRDVKPANLLVTRIQGQEEVRLADFGLARVYESTSLSGLTMKGDVRGTFPFMPPEQIFCFRESKPPVDQYAAGATLYNLLTGAYVYDFDIEEGLHLRQIIQDDIVPVQARRKDIPKKLAEIIHRSVHKDPNKRFANLTKFRQALVPFCQ